MRELAMTNMLANRLLLSRRDLDITQIDLAQRAGNVSAAYISDLERNKVTNPTVEVLEALARALGVDPAYLAGWTDAPLGGEAVAQPRDPRLQELLDLFDDLDVAGQTAALEIIRTLRRTQNARVVGS
jgi:transcriptional regulator with XRE-family HTH domain